MILARPVDVLANCRTSSLSAEAVIERRKQPAPPPIRAMPSAFGSGRRTYAGSNTPLHGLVLGLETSLLGVSLSVARPLSLRSLSTMPLILLGGVQTGD